MASMSISSFSITTIAEHGKTGCDNSLFAKVQSNASSFFNKWDISESLKFKLHCKGNNAILASLPTKGSEKKVRDEKEKNSPNSVALKSFNDSSSNSVSESKQESAFDNIEKKAQKSIDKLKHILYRLKTRPVVEEVSKISGNASFESSLSNIQEEKEVYVSHKLQVDLGSENKKALTVMESIVHESEEQANSLSNSSSKKLYQDDLTHFDSLTCTRTTVQFDEKNRTAVVTVTATVRAADLKLQEASTDRTIAMAARALTRTCLSFENKIQSDLSAVIEENETIALSQKSEKSILEQLRKGKVISFVPLHFNTGESAFRPIYKVTLSSSKGKVFKAIYKPMVAGDAYGRFQHAHPEWVAYRLSSLLGIGLTPPCVIHKNMKMDGQKFASGIMTHFVEEVQPLSSIPLKEWGDAPEMVVSNAHVLDALLGNAPREQHHFFAGRDWLNSNQLRPVVLTHPMGPNLGDLHSMWSTRYSSSGLKTISPEILLGLKKLTFASLVEASGGALNAHEMNLILERKKQVLAYFDSMASMSKRQVSVQRS